MPFTMPYSKLNNVTELSAIDVKFTSVDKQKLDFSKYIYTYGTVNSIFLKIQHDSTNINNDISYHFEGIKSTFLIDSSTVFYH